MDFNKFADAASSFVAKPYFFFGCVLVILIWLPSYFLIGSVDVWQLIINTITTCVTFCLVALLQNDQDRFETATNEKLNALADSIGSLLDTQGLDEDAQRLYNVMGIEKDVKP